MGPQEAYALPEAVGELVCDALARRSDATAVSLCATIVTAGPDYPKVRAMFEDARWRIGERLGVRRRRRSRRPRCPGRREVLPQATRSSTPPQRTTLSAFPWPTSWKPLTGRGRQRCDPWTGGTLRALAARRPTGCSGGCRASPGGISKANLSRRRPLARLRHCGEHGSSGGVPLADRGLEVPGGRGVTDQLAARRARREEALIETP